MSMQELIPQTYWIILRQKHATGSNWCGIDIHNENTAENIEACIWEPAVVKMNALTVATEVVYQIMSLDKAVTNPKFNVDIFSVYQIRGVENHSNESNKYTK